MKNPDIPIEAIINSGDGSRVWHTRVHAQLQPDEVSKGFMLWVGSSQLKSELKAKLSPKVYDYNSAALFIPSNYFRHPRLGLSLDAETGLPTHIGNNCGDKFLGIARLPLPEDKLSPQSRWSGWTHLSHWTNQYTGLPSTEDLFDFLAGNLTSYPKDHADLSRQIVEEFHIHPEDLEPQVLHHYLPWLNPELDRPLNEPI